MSTKTHQKKFFITRSLSWKDDAISINGTTAYNIGTGIIRDIPAAAYRQTGINYPKFFKMDMLSRVAFVAAELLGISSIITEDKTGIATVFSTASGCIDVDKKFEESRQEIASPALFVYTLPNIMLGELCIRHGFKGAQMCFISEYPDAAITFFHVNELLLKGKAEACLCGHVEATEKGIDASLLWISPMPGFATFDILEIEKIYK